MKSGPLVWKRASDMPKSRSVWPAGSSRYGSSSSATRSKIVLSGVLTGKPLVKDTSPRATFRTAKLTVLFLELMRLGT